MVPIIKVGKQKSNSHTKTTFLIEVSKLIIHIDKILLSLEGRKNAQ